MNITFDNQTKVKNNFYKIQKQKLNTKTNQADNMNKFS